MQEGHWLGGWRHVDQSGLAERYAEFLARHHWRADTQAYKRRAYDGLALAPGLTVLDAGCGIGLDAVELARRVGPDGRVIAVDASRQLLEQARAVVAASGEAARIELRQGDLAGLELPDRSVDRIYCDRVAQHLPEALAAVRELRRLTRPGGRLALIDTDWGTLVHGPTDPWLFERLRVHFLARGGLANPFAARTLPALAIRAGFSLAAVEPFGWVEVGDPDGTWARGLVELAQTSTLAGQLSPGDTGLLLAQVEAARQQGDLLTWVSGLIVWADAI